MNNWDSKRSGLVVMGKMSRSRKIMCSKFFKRSLTTELNLLSRKGRCLDFLSDS